MWVCHAPWSKKKLCIDLCSANRGPEVTFPSGSRWPWHHGLQGSGRGVCSCCRLGWSELSICFQRPLKAHVLVPLIKSFSPQTQYSHTRQQSYSYSYNFYTSNKPRSHSSKQYSKPNRQHAFHRIRYLQDHPCCAPSPPWCLPWGMIRDSIDSRVLPNIIYSAVAVQTSVSTSSSLSWVTFLVSFTLCTYFQVAAQYILQRIFTNEL